MVKARYRKTNLDRYFSRAFSIFWGGGIATLSAVLSVAFAVFVWITVSYLLIFTQNFAGAVYGNIGIVAFFNDSITDAGVSDVIADVKKIPGVNSVKYVPPEDALKNLEKSLADYSALIESLPYNPIPPSIEVYVENPEDLEKVAAALEKMGVFDDILVPTDFANKIMRIVSVSRTVVMSVMVLFLFITFVMIFLTISSAILSHHEEIVLYRLLGGSYVFIYFPFVLLGLLYGIAGAIIGTLGAAFAIRALTPGIQALGKAIIGIDHIAVGNMIPVYMVSIVVGLILALIAAMFAIRRFLVEMEVKGL